MGFGGLLRMRASVLSGILNGIDISVWDPQTDPHIAYRFSAADLASRSANKAVLQQQFLVASVEVRDHFGIAPRIRRHRVDGYL